MCLAKHPVVKYSPHYIATCILISICIAYIVTFLLYCNVIKIELLKNMSVYWTFIFSRYDKYDCILESIYVYLKMCSNVQSWISANHGFGQ